MIGIIIDIVLFFVFIGYGGFPGFVAWLALTLVAVFFNRMASAKEVEVALRARQIHRKKRHKRRDDD